MCLRNLFCGNDCTWILFIITYKIQEHLQSILQVFFCLGYHIFTQPDTFSTTGVLPTRLFALVTR